VASSSEQMRLVELLELQSEEGPCFDAYRDGAAVACDSPDDAATRWPRFAPHALAANFVVVSAVPMRLRNDVIGALNLFSTTARALGEDDLGVAQAMADIATIGILQERGIRDRSVFASQLEHALESRVAIEQAKGIVAEHDKIGVDEAFDRIRRFTRSHNRLLSETARQIIDGSLAPGELVTTKSSTR
jgi:hypothetical protein